MKKYLTYLNTLLLSLVIWSFFIKKGKIEHNIQTFEIPKQTQTIKIMDSLVEGKLDLHYNSFHDLGITYKSKKEDILGNSFLQLEWLWDKKPITKIIKWNLNKNEIDRNKPIMLTWKDDKGSIFVQTMQVVDDYIIRIECSVFNATDKQIESNINVKSLLKEHFINYHSNDKVYNTKKSFDQNCEWFGFSSKFSGLFIFPENIRVKLKNSNGYVYGDLGTKIIKPKESAAWSFNLFMGPKDINLLQNYAAKYNAPQLENAISYGYFSFITKPFMKFFDYLNQITGNFIVALIIFTLMTKLLLLPFDYKSHISAVKLQKIQPQLERIREIYKGNNVAIHSATLALYKQESINPLGGCLPFLFQIPILEPLYHVFSGSLAAKYSSFLWIKDLSQPDQMSIIKMLFNMNFPFDVSLLSILFSITMLLQMGTTLKKDQKQTAIMMSIAFAFFTSSSSSGFLIYVIISNLISYMQRMVFNIIIKNNK
ncbi:MAG: YidC/Oxa1 family insertase periplasmic-domain containing protein [Alphaproteobacteria bacterium]|nr:MAG: YidC/Oxa1 family insertase periplasmic-domain containing protein [Alphaproteobacteria bacterium]